MPQKNSLFKGLHISQKKSERRAKEAWCPQGGESFRDFSFFDRVKEIGVAGASSKRYDWLV